MEVNAGFPERLGIGKVIPGAVSVGSVATPATRVSRKDLLNYIHTSSSSSYVFFHLLGNSMNTAASFDDDAQLKLSSTKALNVQELKISEDMQKNDYELIILREKLSRQKPDTVGHNTLKKKISLLENELSSMRSRLNYVCKEKNYRHTMKQLTEF